MNGIAFAGMRRRRAARRTRQRSGASRATRFAVLAAIAASLLMAAPAQAKVNTWQGECTNVPGTAQWPEEPLRSMPAVIRMVVNVDGGSCTGVLNGERVAGVPLHAHIDVVGLQNCSGPSSGDGTGGFTIAGATFTGAAHYRRVGLTGVVVIEGDKGGTFEALARPNVGPEDLDPLIETCNTEGVTTMPVIADRFLAPIPVSSRERK